MYKYIYTLYRQGNQRFFGGGLKQPPHPTPEKVSTFDRPLPGRVRVDGGISHTRRELGWAF